MWVSQWSRIIRSNIEPGPVRLRTAMVAGLALAAVCVVHPRAAAAQRRVRAGRSTFVSALIDVVHLEPRAAAALEDRARSATHRALRDPRSLPTNILLRAFRADGLTYLAASARVEELAGRDDSSADVVGALTPFFARSSDLLSCTMGLHLRVQDCEAARAAVTHTPLDHEWDPGDGRAWADDLVRRGMRRRSARELASHVSALMANILRRPGAGGASLALFRACPREHVAALERQRAWDAGMTPSMAQCIAGWLDQANSRDGAAFNLAHALGLSLPDAMRLHDLLLPEVSSRAADAVGDAPHAAGAPGEQDSVERPHLDNSDIRAVVERERAAIQRCWDEHFVPGAAGAPARIRLDVAATINADGGVHTANATVTQAEDGFAGDDLTSCVETAVRRWRFPPSGGVTNTTIPLVFRREREDAAPPE